MFVALCFEEHVPLLLASPSDDAAGGGGDAAGVEAGAGVDAV